MFEIIWLWLSSFTLTLPLESTVISVPVPLIVIVPTLVPEVSDLLKLTAVASVLAWVDCEWSYAILPLSPRYAVEEVSPKAKLVLIST